VGIAEVGIEGGARFEGEVDEPLQRLSELMIGKQSVSKYPAGW